MRLLKENLVAWALLGLIGVTVLMLALSALWFSRGGPSADEIGTAKTEPLALTDAGQQLQDDESFFEIVERPLFAPDRRPIPIGSAEVEETPVVEEVEPPKQLEATLTGVVTTPNRKIVTLRESGSGNIVRLEEGMPLEGELAGWSVDSIAARSVEFSARTGETARLEMEVYGEPLKAPPPLARRSNRDKDAEKAEGDEQEQADDGVVNEEDEDGELEDVSEKSAEERAQELRRLIAERRERLREQARERAEQQEPNN